MAEAGWGAWRIAVVLAAGAVWPASADTISCRSIPLGLQVLGSGGPELNDQRASSGYIVWHHGRARVLIDLGPGSLLHYEQSGARLEDLEAILITHLHVDHVGDLPALLKGSYFTSRDTGLPIYGPDGNSRYPATGEFVEDLFDSRHGAYRYLGDYLDGDAQFRLTTQNVPADGKRPVTVIDDKDLRVTAIPVRHGPVPALAWRVDIDGHAVVVSGDTSGENRTLEHLAAGADLLVAHHAIPEGATGAARALHMPPSVIGQVADAARVRHLVLSHRMNRTLGREKESLRVIQRHFKARTDFANDGQCFGF